MINFTQQVVSIFQFFEIADPVALQAKNLHQNIQAILSSDGSVELNQHIYPDIDTAMRSLKLPPELTASAWQFWSVYSQARGAWVPLEHWRAEYSSRQLDETPKTSVTHPLRIDAVKAPLGGLIGMTFCPGKQTRGLYSGIWKRALNTDLIAIETWPTAALVTLMENHEFALLRVDSFAEEARARSFSWHHAPIPDMQIPDARFEIQWQTLGPQLHAVLAANNNIVLHCRGGLGRTGLVAARLLIEQGIAPLDAVTKVRAARVHAIETLEQEEYCLGLTSLSLRENTNPSKELK